MRRAWLAMTLLVAGLAEAAPTRLKARESAAAAQGQVRYISSTLAYLDRGSVDGVTVGRELAFTRGGRKVATCVVETVTDHFCACVTDQLRRGDRFAVTRKPVVAVEAPTLAELRVLARRRATLEGTERSLVDFDARASAVAWHGASVTFTEQVFANMAGTGGPFDARRLDAALLEVELVKGLRASADLSVFSAGERSVPYRSPWVSAAQVQLRRLELSYRADGVPVQAALGRLWLRSAPGLLVLDGAQASLRAGDGLEIGAYGGLLPDGASLAINPGQVAAGAFASLRSTSGKGEEATVGLGAVRAGYAVRPLVGARFEVAFDGHLYRGRNLDAHVSTELAYGGAQQAPGGLEAARVDVGYRPSEQLRLIADLRYRGATPAGVVELGLVSPGLRALHGDVTAAWVPRSWLAASLTAGLATDFDGGLTQARVGPELAFPELFGRWGGVSLAYAEELGWLRGRTASGQVSVMLPSGGRVISRTTWFQQEMGDALESDLGESVSLEVRPTPWLWTRLSVSGRMALDMSADASRTAGVASLQVGGQF